MRYIIIDEEKNIISSSDSAEVKHSKHSADGDHLVVYKINIPRNAIKFLKVPFVPNGYENSCSEASAEMILRYYDIVGWSQYEIHRAGYQTFEGNISVGDHGLLNMFRHECFYNSINEKIIFHVKIMEDAKIEDIKQYIDYEIPVIVRIYTNKNKGDRHTIVFIGYNDNGFYYHDNDRGSNRFYRINQFENDWVRTMIVVYPKIEV